MSKAYKKVHYGCAQGCVRVESGYKPQWTIIQAVQVFKHNTPHLHNRLNTQNGVWVGVSVFRNRITSRVKC